MSADSRWADNPRGPAQGTDFEGKIDGENRALDSDDFKRSID